MTSFLQKMFYLKKKKLHLHVLEPSKNASSRHVKGGKNLLSFKRTDFEKKMSVQTSKLKEQH